MPPRGVAHRAGRLIGLEHRLGHRRRIRVGATAAAGEPASAGRRLRSHSTRRATRFTPHDMKPLYDYTAASANCFKVRMLLSQLGLPVRARPGRHLRRRVPDRRVPRPQSGRPHAAARDRRRRRHPGVGRDPALPRRGTPFLPEDRVERAHVHAWMFFEQNLLEPNVGTARFWRLTGRDAERPEAFARHSRGGRGGARGARARAGRQGVPRRRPLLGRRLCALCVHAGRARGGYDMGAYPRSAAWLERVAATPGAIDDLEPYPAAAHGRGRWAVGARPGERPWVRLKPHQC